MNELDQAFEEPNEEIEQEETPEVEPTEENVQESEEEPQEPEEKVEEEEPTSPKMVPLAAVQDERRKVKELREELESLKSKLPKANDEPDMYEDPEAWKQWNREQIQNEYRQETSRQLEKRINDSRDQMIESHADFAQKESAFLLMVQQDPTLTQQMLESVNPAKFAYEKGSEFINSLLPTSKPKPKQPPNLATVTSKGSNNVRVEVENDLDSMFEDQRY